MMFYIYHNRVQGIKFLFQSGFASADEEAIIICCSICLYSFGISLGFFQIVCSLLVNFLGSNYTQIVSI